jgi:hypothetical protein
MVAWQRLPQLLQGPFCGGMSGHVVVENSPRSYFHDHEDVKSAETGRDRHKEVQATITLAWLRTKVSRRCCGSGSRLEPPSWRYFPTVRGETRMPSLSFSSLAMRSSPQLAFSEAIS